MTINETPDLRLALIHRMRTFNRLWTSCADRLAVKTGQTRYSIAPLYPLSVTPAGLRQTELASLLALSEATLTRMVSDLLQAGLVSRRRMAGDGRAWLVRIEPAGLEAIDTYEREASKLRDRLFANVCENDIQAFVRVLDEVVPRLSDVMD